MLTCVDLKPWNGLCSMTSQTNGGHVWVFYDSRPPNSHQTDIHSGIHSQLLPCVLLYAYADGVTLVGSILRYLIYNRLYLISQGFAIRQRHINMRMLGPVIQQICRCTWVVSMPRGYSRFIKRNRQINETLHPRCIISLDGCYKEIQPYMIMP